jgi:hypothetical protein
MKIEIKIKIFIHHDSDQEIKMDQFDRPNGSAARSNGD